MESGASVVDAHIEHPPDVRLIDVNGTYASSGLLQIRTSKGYGTVCGMNPQAVNQACKEMGFTHGWLANRSCKEYGGSDICGAKGTPVAMQNLQCMGHESSLQDCEFSNPDDACKEHGKDSVIWCSDGEPYIDNSIQNGAVRLVGKFGGPAINGKGRLEEYLHKEWHPVCAKGFTLGSAAVACKMMGYSGMDPRGGLKCKDVSKDEGFCGEEIPDIELNCSGKEQDVLNCPHTYDPDADETQCAPNQGVVINCMGDGDPNGLVEKMPGARLKVGTMMPIPLAYYPTARIRPSRNREALREFL
jgi:hypothetical protein